MEGEHTVLVVVDSPGLKGSCKELSIGTIKRTYERLQVKPSCNRRPQCIGDVSSTG